MKLDWINDIADPIQFLTDDYRLIADAVGMDNFIKLFQLFQKTYIYFNSGPIIGLAKEYIKQHPQLSAADIARTIGLSINFVYETRRSLGSNNDQLSLL